MGLFDGRPLVERGENMITRTSDHIKVEGHTGTWYVIDEGVFELTPDTPAGEAITLHARLFLLEHEKYGDEAACVIVDENGKLLLDDVYNGFDDLEDAGWERVLDHECPVCGKRFIRDDMTFSRDCHGITFRLSASTVTTRLWRKGTMVSIILKLTSASKMIIEHEPLKPTRDAVRLHYCYLH